MRFHPLEIAGAMLLEAEPHEDSRGRFARVLCRRELADQGLESTFTQENVSSNRRAGTIRGLHFQKPPYEEAKLVTCLSGSIFDVILDIRPASPTHGRWQSVYLKAGDWTTIYIPKGCAHGFQALEDDTDIFYRMSRDYEPSASAGYRWNSASLGIHWPIEDATLSEADAALPEFRFDPL
jgi:dTDP-4-dehydrorhamnose 3,5-epimerase